ncbi:Ig-like domain-containing protein [Arsenophonus sp.]|uniref:Ig-like domain-containing protein n=1 Tax=Arsenophonus sp. TaxID=1872640 RepID=UPI0038795BEC
MGSVTLVDSEVNKKVADGNNYFTFNAQLVDKYGHPLKKAGLNIEWSHNKEQQITLSAASTTTNDSGIASVTLKSSKIAVDDIIVYAKYRVPPLKPADKKVSFVGDIKTAKVGKSILNDADNNKIADGHPTS